MYIVSQTAEPNHFRWTASTLASKTCINNKYVYILKKSYLSAVTAIKIMLLIKVVSCHHIKMKGKHFVEV